jgi:phosphoribosylaminoimidazole-succinocarboxamide synthase
MYCPCYIAEVAGKNIEIPNYLRYSSSAGLKEFEQLPNLFFTPSTKAEADTTKYFLPKWLSIFLEIASSYHEQASTININLPHTYLSGRGISLPIQNSNFG